MKAKTFFSIILVIILMAVCFGGGFLIFVFKEKPASDKVPSFANGELSIHFLELGNKYAGDSIYIKSGDTDILIDAGSRDSSASTIVSYLDQYVEDGKLEYVIATHSDQDHIAAFVGNSSNEGILSYYDVDMIIDFPLTNKTGSKETQVLRNYYALRDQKVESGTIHYTALECYNEENGAQRTYQLSEGVELEILYNYYYENKSSDENNYSVCVMINQGDNHYLFTGDLEEEGEEQLVDYYNGIGNPLPQCVLFKAGHHGSPTSSTIKLLEVIRPQYVVVCCCAGSPEYSDNLPNQFPSQDFIDRIAPYTDKVYVTTMIETVSGSSWTHQLMNGNIVFNIRKSNIEVICSNSDKILKEWDWFKEIGHVRQHGSKLKIIEKLYLAKIKFFNVII